LGLTDYLAIYGAGLSTGVAVWNVLRTRSKIRVLLTFALIGSEESSDGQPHGGIGISVQNPSANMAHVSNVSFLYRYRVVTIREALTHLIKYKRLPFNLGWCHSSLSNYGLKDGCPISIESGKSHWIFVPEEVLEKLFDDAVSRCIKVVVQDALWRNKHSRAFEYPVPSKAQKSS
jgi:hypothetical protein